MPAGRLDHVRQQVRHAALKFDRGTATDGQLLECFVSRGDAAPLEALVRRHAAMAWGVCRRMLHNHYDAGGAFQATK
jgi:RNA polymerase sigma-70 factor (ECF subfamily)